MCGVCGQASRRIYDRKLRWVRDLSAGDTRIYLEIESRRVSCRSCGKMKQEKLAWLSNNPFYTKRFAFFVGRRCRTSTIQDVARELHLDWRTVKGLDKQYIQEQLRRAGRADVRRWPSAPRPVQLFVTLFSMIIALHKSLTLDIGIIIEQLRTSYNLF